MAMRIPHELVGCQVWRTSFDYQVRLALGTLHPDEGYRVDAELVIEVPFLLWDASGEWHELDPGSGADVAPALELFKTTITRLPSARPAASRSTSTAAPNSS